MFSLSDSGALDPSVPDRTDSTCLDVAAGSKHISHAPSEVGVDAVSVGVCSASHVLQEAPGLVCLVFLGSDTSSGSRIRWMWEGRALLRCVVWRAWCIG